MTEIEPLWYRLERSIRESNARFALMYERAAYNQQWELEGPAPGVNSIKLSVGGDDYVTQTFPSTDY